MCILVMRSNASANLRASQTKCERSELPQIARQVQRSLAITAEELLLRPFSSFVDFGLSSGRNATVGGILKPV